MTLQSKAVQFDSFRLASPRLDLTTSFKIRRSRPPVAKVIKNYSNVKTKDFLQIIKNEIGITVVRIYRNSYAEEEDA